MVPRRLASPITSEEVVRAANAPTAVAVDGDDIWWSESRPEEGGRTAVLRRGLDGTVDEVLGQPWNARTAVHEYGGGAWWVRDGVLWFADWATQRLHRLGADGVPVPLTPEPAGASRLALRGRRRVARRVHRAVRPGGARRGRRCRQHRSSASTPTPRRHRRSSSRARTSCPTRAGAPTVAPTAGWSGITHRCRGTPRGSSSTSPASEPSWPAPAAPSRSSSRSGQPTDRCGSAATGPATGACTAGHPTAVSRRWSTSAGTSASRRGSSATRATPSSTPDAWRSSSPRTGSTTLPCGCPTVRSSGSTCRSR